MIRFKTANHKLPIETGRWNNVDVADRKCTLCEKNTIDDEFHYLLECPFFKRDRQRYIHNIGIKHVFSCINVCQVPREVLKTEAEGRGFQHLPRGLANVNVLENNV